MSVKDVFSLLTAFPLPAGEAGHLWYVSVMLHVTDVAVYVTKAPETVVTEERTTVDPLSKKRLW